MNCVICNSIVKRRPAGAEICLACVISFRSIENRTERMKQMYVSDKLSLRQISDAFILTIGDVKSELKSVGVNVDSGKNSPSAKYFTHRNNAKSRGIPWGFTFKTWWASWEASGQWENRSSSGYVMARKLDIGPYSPDNVYFARAGENVSDGHLFRRYELRRDYPELTRRYK